MALLAYANVQYAQILNEEFDNWTTTSNMGQPYEDLEDWDTNNENVIGGFATAPNIEISVNGDKGVSLTTTYQGIDGHYSGIISQTISTYNLVKIEYLSKCDSIFDQGACVVNIYDSSNTIVYTDSLKQKEANYTVKTIDISTLSLSNSAILKVEFIAFGQLGSFEDFQAYSEFNLLHVKSKYLSNTLDTKLSNAVTVYPNPFDDIINFEVADVNTTEYQLLSVDGSLIKQGTGRSISTVDLAKGQYLLKVLYGGDIRIKRIIKQ